MILHFLLLMTTGLIYFAPSSWKVSNATRIESKTIETEKDVMLESSSSDLTATRNRTGSTGLICPSHRRSLTETRLIAQINADYCTDGMELQFRHCIGTKMQTRHNKDEFCAIK